MWFTSVQIGTSTIGLMIDVFHWVWATEWTLFCVEIIAGYTFYRYHTHLSDKANMGLLVVYSLAAWGSLFWINGILSWQLTPNGWLDSGSVWAGFFNSSFWPSLVYRTAVSLTIASLVACVFINLMKDTDVADRRVLINRAAQFLWAMVPMPVVGLWYLATFPPDSQSWLQGGSIAMTLFLALAIGASTLLGLYAVFGLLIRRLYINVSTALLLVALAFGATAGGEFVREGVRKPYTIRGTLYSNSIREGDVQHLREIGSVTNDPYPLRDASAYFNANLALGAKVYRFQCSPCHTLEGANGLSHLTATWSADQLRHNIAMLQRTKAFMPPFAGTPEELEALVFFLSWVNVGRPDVWPWETTDEDLNRIRHWLDEAGTGPGSEVDVYRSNTGG